MNRVLILFIVAFVLTFSGLTFWARSLPVQASANESIYTDLTDAKCKTIRTGEEYAVRSCPGVGGYKLLAEDGDARGSISVVDPRGKEHPLNYWHVITNAFSYLGDKAEWRVLKKNGKIIPVALIVRVNASENPDNPGQKTSYLAVAKITPRQICVTDKIEPGATANEEARRAADASSGKPCLKE